MRENDRGVKVNRIGGLLFDLMYEMDKQVPLCAPFGVLLKDRGGSSNMS